jgi:hypothetical protein
MVSFKNMFFALGGVNSGKQILKECEMMTVEGDGSYLTNLKSSTWGAINKMNYSRHNFGAVVSEQNRKIFAFGCGGTNYSNTIEVYDMRDKFWRALPLNLGKLSYG